MTKNLFPTFLAGVAVIAAAGVVAAPARADTLIAAAPNAKNLASGGGWYAWAAPQPGGRWRLTVRNPATGLVSVPNIPDFGSAPEPAIGSALVGSDFSQRKLVVAYSRCAGASTTSGCDVWALDIAAGTESRVAGLSSRTYSETEPSTYLGTWSFVRRGNVSSSKKGVFVRTRGGTRRLSPTLARETSVSGSGSRVAYAYNSSKGGGVALRRASGEGDVVTLTSQRDEIPHSLNTTRYRASWLEGTTAWQTTRFGGSGEPHSPPLVAQLRALPATTDGIVMDDSAVIAYMDTAGVTSISPPLFPN
ncbi:MAG: hypothetical protein JHC95_01190 [Solirubrobacteraceae bacterium]|nr:hypothetical protein [Solirubrobacteraceae bacterium]